MNHLPARAAGRTAAAAALVTLLAACHSGSPAPAAGVAASSSPPSGSGQQSGSLSQPPAVNACKLLTPAEVRQVTGVTVGPFKPDLPGEHNVCLAFAPTIEVNVSVHASSSLTFGSAKPSGTRPVSGLGDKAYCQAGNLVWVLTGSQELGVSASTCAQAAALARIALSRL